MAIKFKGLSMIPASDGRIELYDGEGVEFCNSINSLINVLKHYNSHGELPDTTQMREAMEFMDEMLACIDAKKEENNA